MYYYIYQITNLINNKIYIGVHKTKNMNDNYMGSGKIIKSAIEKYGIENFRKDILEFFGSYEEALNREKEIVNEEFLLREDVYNLRRGGYGGFDYINNNGIPKFLGKKHTEETKKKLGHPGNNFTKGKFLGNNFNPLLRNKGNDHPASKPKTEEHKQKLRKANLGVKHNKIKCPHCGKEGGERAIKRWHKNCGIGIVAVP
jgi:group I intron endonuclease